MWPDCTPVPQHSGRVTSHAVSGDEPAALSRVSVAQNPKSDHPEESNNMVPDTKSRVTDTLQQQVTNPNPPWLGLMKLTLHDSPFAVGRNPLSV